MKRLATEQCRACEAEFSGPVARDEDGRGFVDFAISPFYDCGLCGKPACIECSKRCVTCRTRLCLLCQVQTDSSKMCASCSADYMLSGAA